MTRFLDPQKCRFSFEPTDKVNGFLHAHAPAKFISKFHHEFTRNKHFHRSVIVAHLLELLLKESTRSTSKFVLAYDADAEGSSISRFSVNKDFTFKLAVDVATECQVPNSIDMDVFLPPADITDDLIEDEVRNQCVLHGSKQSAISVTRPSEVIADIELRLNEDELPIWQDTSVAILIDRDDTLRISGEEFPDVLGSLVGQPTGAIVHLESKFGRSSPSLFLRNKAVSIRLSIKKIQSVQFANVDHVLMLYGGINEQRLRTQIEFSLRQHRKESISSYTRMVLRNALPELFSIDLPKCTTGLLLKQEKHRLCALGKKRGINDNEIDEEWLRIESRLIQLCEKTAQQQVILRSLERSEKVAFLETMLHSRIAYHAAKEGKRPEEYRSDLVSTGRFEQFLTEAREENILDFLAARTRKLTLDFATWTKRCLDNDPSPPGISPASE